MGGVKRVGRSKRGFNKEETLECIDRRGGFDGEERREKDTDVT